ncbi:MAG: alginate export family protein [Planctomycetota bacterium]
MSAPILALLFLAFTTRTAPADEIELSPSDLRVGHWVEVRGELDDLGRFVASKVEPGAEERYESLTGVVTSHDVADGALVLLGVPVAITDRAEWTSIAPGDLTGRRVRIEGRYRGPDRFSARDVRPWGEGRDRMSGRIDSLTEVEGGIELTLLGRSVVLAPDCEVESEYAADDLPRYEQRWSEVSVATTIDEDDLLEERFEIAPGVRVGGQIEYERTDETDFDLDGTDPNDRLDDVVSARLRLGWAIRHDVTARAEAKFRQRWRDDDQDGRTSDDELEFGETWLHLSDVFGEGVDLRVGRQDFDDPREWIYDQDLDAVRLYGREDTWRWELALATTLGSADRRDEGSLDVSAYVSSLDDDRHLAAWMMHRDPEELPGTRLTHVGVRAIGDWLDPFETWAELSAVVGEEAGRDVRGFGYDVGFVAHDRDWPLAFAAGLAFGSGDDGSGTDTAYRQTGLQDNNGKLGTATSIRYYGELVDPELSNLRVATLALSWWFEEHSTLALVWHDFAQVEAATFLRDTDLDADPNGLDRHLGSELDLVLGTRAFEDFDVEIAAGVFFPGAAFAEDDEASFVRMQVRYRF